MIYELFRSLVDGFNMTYFDVTRLCILLESLRLWLARMALASPYPRPHFISINTLISRQGAGSMLPLDTLSLKSILLSLYPLPKGALMRNRVDADAL